MTVSAVSKGSIADCGKGIVALSLSERLVHEGFQPSVPDRRYGRLTPPIVTLSALGVEAWRGEALPVLEDSPVRVDMGNRLVVSQLSAEFVKDQRRFIASSNAPADVLLVSPNADEINELGTLVSLPFHVVSPEQVSAHDLNVSSEILGYPPAALSDVLVSDTWIYLSEASRQSLIRDAYARIRPGGTLRFTVSIPNSGLSEVNSSFAVFSTSEGLFSLAGQMWTFVRESLGSPYFYLTAESSRIAVESMVADSTDSPTALEAALTAAVGWRRNFGLTGYGGGSAHTLTLLFTVTKPTDTFADNLLYMPGVSFGVIP